MTITRSKVMVYWTNSVDRLVGAGLSGSRVRNVLVPLQALYRRHRREVPVNLTRDLDLPETGGTREWHGTSLEAEAKLAALPASERPLWATALFAGLCRGELRALRVSDVHGLTEDAEDHFIDVTRGWDDREGEIPPNSAAGVRRVPLPETLRVLLIEHVRRICRVGDNFIFGATGCSPFAPSYVRATADKAWKAKGFERVTLHEYRHGYASFLDAAGVSEARADRYLGHAGTTVSDRYRHQLRGQLVQDAALLDAFITGKIGQVIQLKHGSHARDAPAADQAH
jgi:integrase